MARTNSDSVQSILLGDYDNASSLQSFIDTASALVDRVATCAQARDVSLTGTELELIERWLAAHYYACVDQPYSEKQTGQARGKFQGQTGMSLEGTKYGQTALSLDVSGCLNALSKRHSARLIWLGKSPSSQIDYQERD